MGILTWQRYLYLKEFRIKELQNKVVEVRDHFRQILNANISLATALSLLYKEDPAFTRFNDAAKDLFLVNKYADITYVTQGFTIKKIYPLEGNQMVMNKSLLTDSFIKKEALLAIANKNILFTGPYALYNGTGMAIAGRLPVWNGGHFQGFVIVITRITTIQRFLNELKDVRYNFQLSKVNPVTKKTELFFSDRNINSSETVSTAIPEGNWQLSISYREGKEPKTALQLLMGMGLLISLSAGVIAYLKVSEKTKLEALVGTRTHELGERVKELSCIYRLNNILQDDKLSMEEALQKIVEILPISWQYPEDCGARICFNERVYLTSNYQKSPFSQQVKFKLLDGREGVVEVVYIKEKPIHDEGPFLKEERNLIDVVADTISIYFNKRIQQQLLSDSEQKFRATFEFAAIGMATIASDGAFLLINPALKRMLSYSDNELFELNAFNISYPEDNEKERELLNDVLSNKINSYQLEKRFYTKSGALLWTSVNMALVRSNEDASYYFIAEIEDINNKIEAEKKYQNIVEQSLVGVYIFQGGQFVYVNPALVQESGYTEEELLLLPQDKYVYKDDLAMVRSNVARREKGEKDTIRYTFRAVKKGGEILWYEIFGATIDFNGKRAVIGTMVNITERQQILDKLRQSEANLRSIFNSTQVGYLVLDYNYKVLDFNHQQYEYYQEATGVKLELGLLFTETIPIEKRKRAVTVFDEVKKTGHPAKYFTSYDFGSTHRHFQIDVTAIITDGEVIGICTATIDITVLKVMELERERVIRRLLKQNQDLQDFSYIISHNVRGPLSSLMGVISLLNDTENTEAEKQFLVSAINESAQKLDVIIHDINDILNLKEELLEEKQELLLQDMVNDIIMEHAVLMTSSGVKINTDFSNAPSINTIPSALKNIFRQLMINGIQHRHPQRVPLISVTSAATIDEVTITFEDHGCGIDLKRHGGKLFKLYEPINIDTAGRGMGLF